MTLIRLIRICRTSIYLVFALGCDLAKGLLCVYCASLRQSSRVGSAKSCAPASLSDATELSLQRRHLIPEKIAYRRASDEGRALTETRFQTLNQRAHKLAQSVIDFVTKLQIWLSRVQESPN